MIKDFTEAMKLFVLVHTGCGIIYYFYYSYLIIHESAPMEVSKNMLIAFTVVNVLVYFVSNQLNQEKVQALQSKSEYYLYALLVSEVILLVIAFGVLGK